MAQIIKEKFFFVLIGATQMSQPVCESIIQTDFRLNSMQIVFLSQNKHSNSSMHYLFKATEAKKR